MHYTLPAANGRTESVELDSYRFLGTLVSQEADFARARTNGRGQTLSTDLLLRRAWDHYLAERSPAAEVADHSNLHLVELLLAFNRTRSAGSSPTSGVCSRSAAAGPRSLATAAARRRAPRPSPTCGCSPRRT